MRDKTFEQINPFCLFLFVCLFVCLFCLFNNELSLLRRLSPHDFLEDDLYSSE